MIHSIVWKKNTGLREIACLGYSDGHCHGPPPTMCQELPFFFALCPASLVMLLWVSNAVTANRTPVRLRCVGLNLGSLDSKPGADTHNNCVTLGTLCLIVPCLACMWNGDNGNSHFTQAWPVDVTGCVSVVICSQQTLHTPAGCRGMTQTITPIVSYSSMNIVQLIWSFSSFKQTGLQWFSAPEE